MNVEVAEKRILALDVAFNVRHIHGYPAALGLTAGNVYRGASLHGLTEDGVETLAECGVRTVVDLRSTAEQEQERTPDLSRFGINVIAASVFQQDASPLGMNQAEFPGFAAVYQRFLESGGAAYGELCGALARESGGVLFHCAAGKDRTGVAAALLLELAGVPDQTIVDDYTLSEALLSPLRDEWLPKMAARGVDQERAEGLLAAPSEAMRSTLAYLRRRWGSAEGYFTACGVSSDAISAVRARLLPQAGQWARAEAVAG
jgi:protein-tyrosine phosphatase